MSTQLFKERNRRARNSRLMLQALHRNELRDSGQRLNEGREATQRELQRIAVRLTPARQAGISMAEISELTGLSRPTLYQLEKEHGASNPENITATLLGALGSLGPQTSDQLSGVTKIAEDVVKQMVSELVARELIGAFTGYYPAGAPTTYLVLTEAGAQLLQTLLTKS